MERIYSSAPLFFGASKEAPTTFCIRFLMADPIDGELLRHALREAIARYPYLSVQVEMEAGWYILRENPAPIPVYEGTHTLPLGGKAANGHLMSFSYCGCALRVDMFHRLTDGRGFLRLLRTVFYYYCTEKYGPLPCVEGIALKGDPIPEAEILDPYPENVDESILPMGRYTGKAAAQLFPKGKKGTWNSIISIPEDAFVRFSKQQDGSSAVVTALLMARAVRTVLGETEKPIVCGMAMDARPVLQKPEAHHSVVSQLFLEYGKKMEKMDLIHQVTAFRGMVILQSQPENVLTSVRNNIRFIRKLEELPDLSTRKTFMAGVMKRAMQSDTFKVSYVGSQSMGPADPYIESSLPAFIDINGAGAMLEVCAFKGRLSINFLQESDDERYLHAFLRELETAGIQAAATPLAPFSIANIDFCGAGEQE